MESPPKVYMRPGFLPSDTCRDVRRAMDRGVEEPAEVLEASVQRRERVRRAASIDIDEAVRLDVEKRLDGERTAIARFHGVTLAQREGAGFIRYPDGGFYRPHADRAALPSWPDAARRQIAIVVFLNSSGSMAPDGAFTGGTLRVFLDAVPVELEPQAGVLVAFPADALHEVTVVHGGVRDAIVDWFY